MRGSVVKRMKKAMQLHIKRNGTDVLLEWCEWPNGKPDADGVTGAVVATEENPREVKSFTAKAFTHQIAPLENKVRMHAELTIGSAMVDFGFPFYRVTDAGDTALEVGQVVDELAWKRANRETTGEAATVESLDINTLEDLTATFNGQKWVQCEISDKLKSSLDAVYANINFASTIVVRRLT